ncbi:MAG TPA: flagellin [Gemmatimonadaceae bacterium]
MRINTNVSAIQAYTNLGRVNNALQNSMAKLSSGLRINKAADDAAGLGIANSLRASNRALGQAAKNGEQASALLNVAEGGASAVEGILERMKELAAQSASSNSGDRAQLQAEFNTLRTEITRITDTTIYQGNHLINGTMGNKIDTANTTAATGIQTSTLQVNGAKAGVYTIDQVDATHMSMTDASGNVQVVTVADGVQTVNFSQFGVSFKTASTYVGGTAATTPDGQVVEVDAGTSGADFLVSAAEGEYTDADLVSLATSVDLTTGATGLNIAASDISTQTGAQAALAALDTAVTTVNTALGSIGAAQNRIGFALDNTKTAIANFAAAESTIRDVDMAEEMTNFSKSQILAQAGTAMLAQANQVASSVLRLFQ